MALFSEREILPVTINLPQSSQDGSKRVIATAKFWSLMLAISLCQ